MATKKAKREPIDPMQASAQLDELREKTSGLIEELGQALGLMREADASILTGNLQGAAMCLADAEDILFTMGSGAYDRATNCESLARAIGKGGGK